MTQPAAEWIGKQEAATRLKLSERTIFDLAKKGKIRSKKQTDPERRNQVTTLFNSADVERYGFERDNPVEVANGLQLPRLGDDPLMDELLTKIVPATLQMLGVSVPSVDPSDIPWMTLENASVYSGLPCSTLNQLIQAGRLPVIDTWGGKERKGGGLPGGRYRIKRSDLDALEGQKL